MKGTRFAFRVGTRLLSLLVAAALAGGCSGYADLPVPLREQAPLLIEAVDLHPGHTGRVQVRADLPGDLEDTLHVLSSPITFDPTAAVLGWSVGPCAGLDAPQEAVPSRLCVAVVTASGVGADAPFTLNVLFEARAAARRFTATGEVTP